MQKTVTGMWWGVQLDTDHSIVYTFHWSWHNSDFMSSWRDILFLLIRFSLFFSSAAFAKRSIKQREVKRSLERKLEEETSTAQPWHEVSSCFVPQIATGAVVWLSSKAEEKSSQITRILLTRSLNGAVQWSRHSQFGKHPSYRDSAKNSKDFVMKIWSNFWLPMDLRQSKRQRKRRENINFQWKTPSSRSIRVFSFVLIQLSSKKKICV